MLPGVVCVHVGDDAQKVRQVLHDPPIDAELSGWQLTCSGLPHDGQDIRFTDLDRIAGQDASLRGLLDTLAEGYLALRQADGQPWVIEPIPAQDEAISGWSWA